MKPSFYRSGTYSSFLVEDESTLLKGKLFCKDFGLPFSFPTHDYVHLDTSVLSHLLSFSRRRLL